MKTFLLCFTVLMMLELQAQQKAIESVDALIISGEYAEAVQRIDQALLQSNNTTEEISILKLKKAEALVRLSKFEDAQLLLHQVSESNAIQHSDYLKGLMASTTGALYLYQGRNDLALEALQNSLALYDKAAITNHADVAQSLSYLGNLYRITGKYNQAEEYLNRSLSIRQKLASTSNEFIAAAYNDLGLVFTFTDPDRALDYYEKALALYEEQHGKDHPKIAIANTNIGFVYTKLEFFGDAINNFERSLAIWNKLHAGAYPAKAFVLFNLGQVYQKMHDMKTAKLFYEQALTMYREAYGERHPEISRIENALGALALSANHYDLALSHFQKALAANALNFNSNNYLINPSINQYYDGITLLYSLLSKAQALESRYYGKTLKFGDLTFALKTLALCDSLVDQLRGQINNESDKITLGAISNEVYADGVRIAFASAAVSINRKTFEKLSFYFAEKSKSAVLLGAIAESNAKSYAGIPVALLDEEKAIKSTLARYTQKLAEKPSAEEEQFLRTASFDLTKKYLAFTKNLEKNYPEYFNLKYNTASPSIEQLQAKLDEKTSLWSYFIDEKNYELYIFIIDRMHFRITHQKLPKDIDRYITGIRNGIFFSDQKVYLKAASLLSEVLIPKGISAKIKDVVILPTGRLSIVPFEALFTGKVKLHVSYAALPYLLKTYSIRYEFSTSLILQKQLERRSDKLSIFLCAPVTFNETAGLDELPGTEKEVNAIDELFKSRNLSSGLYLHAQANEAVVKSPVLNDYDLIHFATHGIVDEKNPELSRIFLQRTSGAEDGDLFAGEVYNLKLNANLVTLSACETGLGKISKGEGVIGLSRALVYAGAKNCMVSFWNVSDASTSVLMKDFYEEMLKTDQQTRYSTFLKKAKLKLMTDEKYASPYYWAPFILIGF